MTRRAARPDDLAFVVPLLDQAYSAEWAERHVQRRLESTVGAQGVDRAGGAYCYVASHVRDKQLGPLPTGPVTQIIDLLPQHRDQRWVDTKLFPLLIYTLRRHARKEPDALDFPLFGFLPPDLIPFWEGKMGSVAASVSGRGTDIIYVATLREALGAS